MSVPYGERGGPLRGAIDLVCGRLPRFVFGGAVGAQVPVFHFHDETRGVLEPAFRYLRENGYETLTADELSAVVHRRRPIRGREVALCFDDAWASVWTDAVPLLRQYRLRAIVYPIPGRIVDAPAVAAAAPAPPGRVSPFMTWEELRAVHAEGVIDVQSHTWLHARIFTAGAPVDFVRPDFGRWPTLNRPLLSNTGGVPRFVDPSELGAPIYEHRSRMSDGRRVQVSLDAHNACVGLVRAEGGAAFFSKPDWRSRLSGVVADRAKAPTRPAPETDDEQRRAIEDELDRARSELRARLGAAVRHVCLPWGVSGSATARALARLGFETAIANRWAGAFAVRPGDPPYWLKRLPNRYIFTLPGADRRTLLSLGRAQ